jgi:uncharacterized protein (TIGR02598 family)
MKRSFARSGFSLIEVTFALGVAAFCLIAVMGLLPVGVQTNRAAVQQTTANDILAAVVSDIRTVPIVSNSPGNSSKQFKLYFSNPHNSQPQFLYFSNDGSTGTKSDNAYSDTVFYATISYMPDPAGAGPRTAMLVDVKVSWPYNGNTSSTPDGFVETFLALDRN